MGLVLLVMLGCFSTQTAEAPGLKDLEKIPQPEGLVTCRQSSRTRPGEPVRDSNGLRGTQSPVAPSAPLMALPVRPGPLAPAALSCEAFHQH